MNGLITRSMRMVGLALCIVLVTTRTLPPHAHETLTIHHAPGTRGLRAIWLCEELGVPYRVEPVDFSGAYRATPEWRRMNPVGKVPVMSQGAFKMFESGAMIQHLLEVYDEDHKLQPRRGTEEHGHFLQWCWFAEATFCRATGELANHRREFAESGLLESVMEEMRERARACMRALDDTLADGRPYLMGDGFTAADVMMGYAFISFERNVGVETLPFNAEQYWQRLKARPGYQRAFDANLCKAVEKQR